MPSPRLRDSRPFFFDRRQSERTGKRSGHDFEQAANGGEFFGRQNVEQCVGLPALPYRIGWCELGLHAGFSY